MRFVEGHEYSRQKDIHANYAGQERGGISTPPDHPYVFIFTGKNGKNYGYEDGWKGENIFLYTGEGQKGNMRFVRGNAAVRDHVANGKELLLFEALGHSKPVRFIGNFACQSWDTYQGTDNNNDLRECIRFHLVKLTPDMEPSPDEAIPVRGDAGLIDLRERAMRAAVSSPSKNWANAPASYRARSRAVREYVLARAGGRCELTGKPAPFLTKSGQPYLEVHHTRRLSDDGPDDPRFVAAIDPTVHRQIHFGENGNALNAELIEKLRTIEPEQ
ncbi:hypothetical protein [Thalassovita aquimarina]|uniref:HNH endonuclease n=1 Tax=Thalassovita aquimarina TaxID=2785917 RepID=A0ABS5HV03_9RHOB|nr:hypothetical protein [Thalassovita aquimarina]MBR9652724.1 HNH endonuclease [Thalassovita aquimarina]